MKKLNVNENTLINLNTLEKEYSLGKCTKKLRKGNCGITLIALVITILFRYDEILKYSNNTIVSSQ